MDASGKQQEEFYKEAGQRILQVRSLRHYTREYLAEAAGISEKFLYEIENGRKGFSAASLWYLCQVLQVSTDYILNGSREESDEKLEELLETFQNTQKESLSVILKEIQHLAE